MPPSLPEKSVVTANKELMALARRGIWERAIEAGTNVAMEASVAGGIPIHAVLREGISGDRVVALYGILNGTSNYILTEMEQHGTPLETVLAEAQRLGYAEANPSNDIDGFDARSKLAILSALAFGEKITPGDIFTEGIRRLSPMDFQYAHRLGHTIRLLCAARQTPEGLILSVRPALIPQTAILASVRSSYNAIWVQGTIRRGHVLLRPRRGSQTHRRGRGERPDARGARDSGRQPHARLALRASAPGRIQAHPGDAPDPLLLRAVPRGRPAGHHRGALGHPGREDTSASRPCSNCRTRTSWICRSSSRSNPPPSKPCARPPRRWRSSTSCWNRRWCCRWSRRCSAARSRPSSCAASAKSRCPPRFDWWAIERNPKRTFSRPNACSGPPA